MTTVADVSDGYIRGVAALDPVRALGMFGTGGSGRTVTDYSPEGFQARRDLYAALRDQLRTAEAVGEADRLGRLFLSDELDRLVHLHDAGEYQRQVSAIFGPQASLRAMFDLVDTGGDDQWDAVGDRLAAVPAAIEGYRRSLRASAAEGRSAPGRLVAAVSEQCRLWAGDGGGGWFSAFAAGYGGGRLADRLGRVAAEADAAYGELATWLTSSYLPNASDQDGVGEERYHHWFRALLGARMDVADAYRWGWEELARLEEEKAAESDRVIPGATFAEVRHVLSTDPGRAIDGVDAWRAWLQDLTDAAIERLHGAHFDIPDPLRRCRVGIPPEGTAAAPYYTPPGEDLVRPGQVWFPTIGRSSFPTWDGPTTIYHEAVPGHHLQLGTTRTVDLVSAQRMGFNSAHGEGWALYAERFMDDLGAFQDPAHRLGFLAMQAFRAARVVVDIGLHTGREIPDGWPGAGRRWDHDLAVDAIERACGLSRDFCQSEVLRYLSMPAQAACYKLGERVWLAGREDARRRAGPDFSLKDWHARALALGPIGLDALSDELARLG
ncbi:MAG TPA: DUF885 domain-containing protein [Acidimicrobiales bacterium]|nr:DUF885 domain-containing protein [Acidimicrobiales bacterium]